MKNVKELKFNNLGGDVCGLISLESNKNIPFDIERVYYLFNCLSERRGFHAHKTLEQVLVVTSGSCTVLCDDGVAKKEFHLDSPTKGLYIGSHIWHEMYNFSQNCVLMVAASQNYSEDDYIRNYDTFLKAINNLD